MRRLWNEKPKLPLSFDAFLKLASKWNNNDELILKELSKKSMHYNKEKNQPGKCFKDPNKHWQIPKY